MLKRSLIFLIILSSLLIFVSCPAEVYKENNYYYLANPTQKSYITDVEGYLDLSKCYLKYRADATGKWHGKVPSGSGEERTALLEFDKNGVYKFKADGLNSEVGWDMHVWVYRDASQTKLLYEGSGLSNTIVLKDVSVNSEKTGTIKLRVFIQDNGIGGNFLSHDVQNNRTMIDKVFYRYGGDESSKKEELQDGIWERVTLGSTSGEYGYAYGRVGDKYNKTKKAIALTSDSNYFYDDPEKELSGENYLSNIVEPFVFENLPYGYHFYYFTLLVNRQRFVGSDSTLEVIGDELNYVFCEPVMVYLDKNEVTVDVFIGPKNTINDGAYNNKDIVSTLLPDVVKIDPNGGEFSITDEEKNNLVTEGRLVYFINPNEDILLDISDFKDDGEDGIINDPHIFGGVFYLNFYGAKEYKWYLDLSNSVDKEYPKLENGMRGENVYSTNKDDSTSYERIPITDGQIFNLRDNYVERGHEVEKDEGGNASYFVDFMFGRGIKEGDKIIVEAEKDGKTVKSTITFTRSY